MFIHNNLNGPAHNRRRSRAKDDNLAIIAPVMGDSMRRARCKLRRWPALAWLLLLWLALPAPLWAAGAGGAGAPVLDFGLAGADRGWALTTCALYWTEDGAAWRPLHPPGIDAAAPLDAALAGGQRLLVVQPVGAARAALRVAATDDEGHTWNVQMAELPSVTAADAAVTRVIVEMRDQENGWLSLRYASSSNFSRSAHFITADGGRTWQPQNKASPRVPEQGDGGRVIFATPAAGWRLAAGRQLQRTADSGVTWQLLALPACPPAPARGASPNAASGATIPLPPGLVSIGQGAAFDICELPTPGDLAAWRSASPYRIVNLYIGGNLRACPNRALNRELLDGLAAAGWRFIPTWVGPQAPCTDYQVRFSADVNAARAAGQTEAAQALAVAQTLGLAAAERGSVIYYDLEAFDASDATCTAAAQAFVQGWSAAVRAGGSLAGLYTSACWPDLGLYAAVEPPDAVWMAHWVRPAFDPAVTVWDVPCVANSLWVNQQRIRQYTGGHDETWGGVTLNIDANVADGPVADLTRGWPFTTTVVVEEPELTPADDGNLCRTAWYRYTNPRGYPAFLTLNRRLGEPPPPIINQAAWAPVLPVAGVYRVEVYLPEHEAVQWACPAALLELDSGAARYTVEHAAGTTVQVIDQMATRGGWVDLGVYSFAAETGARLTLSDETGEAQFTVTLSASAARFTLVPAAESPPQAWLPLVAR